MLFRFRYTIKGGHVHVRVFAAKRPAETWEKSGELVFRTSEWDDVKETFAKQVEFKHEESE